jgi:anti-anti-sigma factor
MHASITVVRLTGELEIGRRDEIAGALCMSGEETGILLDFSDVSYADSTALSQLLRFRNDAAAREVPVAVLIGNRQLARLIEYAGLREAFHIFENRASALSDLAQAASQ